MDVVGLLNGPEASPQAQHFPWLLGPLIAEVDLGPARIEQLDMVSIDAQSVLHLLQLFSQLCDLPLVVWLKLLGLGGDGALASHTLLWNLLWQSGLPWSSSLWCRLGLGRIVFTSRVSMNESRPVFESTFAPIYESRLSKDRRFVDW